MSTAGDALGDQIKTNIDAVGDKTNRTSLFRAIGNAIVDSRGAFGTGVQTGSATIAIPAATVVYVPLAIAINDPSDFLTAVNSVIRVSAGPGGSYIGRLSAYFDLHFENLSAASTFLVSARLGINLNAVGESIFSSVTLNANGVAQNSNGSFSLRRSFNLRAGDLPTPYFDAGIAVQHTGGSSRSISVQTVYAEIAQLARL